MSNASDDWYKRKATEEEGHDVSAGVFPQTHPDPAVGDLVRRLFTYTQHPLTCGLMKRSTILRDGSGVRTLTDAERVDLRCTCGLNELREAADAIRSRQEPRT